MLVSFITLALRLLSSLFLHPLAFLLLTLRVVVSRRPARVELHVQLALLPSQLVVLGLLLPAQAMPLERKQGREGHLWIKLDTCGMLCIFQVIEHFGNEHGITGRSRQYSLMVFSNTNGKGPFLLLENLLQHHLSLRISLLNTFLMLPENGKR